jgi:hypothetical protein
MFCSFLIRVISFCLFHLVQSLECAQWYAAQFAHLGVLLQSPSV